MFYTAMRRFLAKDLGQECFRREWTWQDIHS